MQIIQSLEDLRERTEKENLDLPYSEDVSVLTSPCTIGKRTAPNRIACQAMEGCDGTFDGRPDELTKRRYNRLAEGGAGLIWFEATAVMKEARANPRQLFINKENLDDFKRIVEKIRQDGEKKNGYVPLIICQLTHSGRYSKPNGIPEPIIAYNNPVLEGNKAISSDRIVSDAYLDEVMENLVLGAELAEEAGFDGADIKCCHRYLNSELLSAYNRQGRYGGSLENRSRLLRESIDGANQLTSSDFIVTSRLNVYDGLAYPYGFGVKKDGSKDIDLSEAKELLKMLSEKGVDFLNITMGNQYFNPHINRPFAKGAYEPPESPMSGVERMLNGTKELKTAVPSIKLLCSGLSYLGTTAPNVASAYINGGAFDLAGFGREIFAYPDFARDILEKGEMKKEKSCICCSKCTELMRNGSTPGCVIRDTEVYLPLYKKVCLKK